MAILDEKLVDEIIRGWRILDIKQHLKDFPCGVPDKNDIDHLVRIAFFASIQREESKFITFSFTYLLFHQKTRPPHLPSDLNVSLKLTSPEELSVTSLRKLAGAVDDKASALMVEKRDGQFWITGIIPFGRTFSQLGNGPNGYPRPEALTITVVSPGSITVSRGNSVIGRFVNGEFTMAEPTPFHSEALGGDIISRIESHPQFAQFGNHYWFWYSGVLDHLLRAASGRGHGGTIMWVPTKSASLAVQRTALGYQLNHFPHVLRVLQEVMLLEKLDNDATNMLIEAQRSGRPNQQAVPVHASAHAMYRGKLIAQLNALAQLTAIDGAVLLDEHLLPLVFGARLQAPEWHGKIHPGPRRGYTSFQDIPRNRFGTRHNSAIDFVAAIPGTIAFVISQDGPIRAITRRADAVHIWPDCLSTVFLHG